jgi:para-nitrobenzyl esterase
MAEFVGASPEEVREVARLYPLSDFEGSPHQAFVAMGSDMVLSCPTWSGLAAASSHQSRSYLYRFDYDRMILGKRIGAMHAMEMPFIFDSQDRAPMNLLYDRRRREESRGLVRAMQGYWLNFAKNGDPNGAGLPPWPAFDIAQPQAMIFNLESRSETLDLKDRCDYWENYNNTNLPLWETMGRHQD